MTRTLAVRLDSLGDVLVTGPAVRALAHHSDHLTLLCGPQGRAAAELLPGVDDLVTWACPWIVADPPPTTVDDLDAIASTLAAGDFDRAVVFTSFHQSPLPTALLLRRAGIGWVGAISDDYPGSLLDVRHRVEGDPPEPERALSLAAACGAGLPTGDDGRLALRDEVAPRIEAPVPYVVIHPGTSVPARAAPADLLRDTCRWLTLAGTIVVVTGAPDERGLTAYVAGGHGVDRGGRTDLAALASLMAGAEAVVVGNTGPAHLAAAVGTPVVSLFAPTVPAARWAPYGVASVVLGDQLEACAGSRARSCPVPGHPCLSSLCVVDVVEALRSLPTALDLPSPDPSGGRDEDRPRLRAR